MNVTELDRWRTAQQLIEWNGHDAELDAALRADAAIAAGNPEGESLWRDILKKVRVLQQDRPPDSPLN